MAGGSPLRVRCQGCEGCAWPEEPKEAVQCGDLAPRGGRADACEDACISDRGSVTLAVVRGGAPRCGGTCVEGDMRGC